MVKTLLCIIFLLNSARKKKSKDYLIRHDINTTVIPQILTQLKEEKWLDDSKYIDNILQQNLHSGDKGAFILKQKLLQKGIESQLIEDMLKDFDFCSICIKTAQKLLKNIKVSSQKELSRINSSKP